MLQKYIALSWNLYLALIAAVVIAGCGGSKSEPVASQSLPVIQSPPGDAAPPAASPPVAPPRVAPVPVAVPPPALPPLVNGRRPVVVVGCSNRKQLLED